MIAKVITGKVKWFNNKTGFGFIVRDDGRDVFVHHTAILGTGYKTLREGETVCYQLVNGDSGPRAINVERHGTVITNHQ